MTTSSQQHSSLMPRVDPNDLGRKQQVLPFQITPTLDPYVMTEYNIATVNNARFNELRKNSVGALGVDEELRRLAEPPFDTSPQSIPFSLQLHALHSIERTVLEVAGMEIEDALLDDHNDINAEVSRRRAELYFHAARDIESNNQRPFTAKVDISPPTGAFNTQSQQPAFTRSNTGAAF